MKTFLIIISALIATSQAQIISENGANYFVYPSAGGNTMVSGPQGCTYIQPSPIGANVINTGRGIDQGAIVAAQMARPAPMPQTSANPLPDPIAQYNNQQSTVWAQANQTMIAALALMPPRVATLNQRPAKTDRDYKDEISTLISTLNAKQKKLFFYESKADWEGNKGDVVDSRGFLAYLRLWMKTHPEIVASNVAAHP
jgi:hypothetical protein